MSAPAAIASSTCVEALRLDLDRHLLTRRLHLAAPPRRRRRPSRMWLSLIRIPSSSPARWLVPPPARTAYFSSARSVGVVLRVSRIVIRAAGGVDEPARQRRDPGQPLQKIERRPFGGQHRAPPCPRPPRRRRPARSDRRRRVLSVNAAPRDRAAGTPRPRRRGRRCTQSDLARITPRPRSVGVDRRLGRDVAPAEVLGERAADDLAVERRDRAARTARVFTAPRSTGTLSGGASVTSTCSTSASLVSSRWISPDARKSASTVGSSASIAAGARTTTTATRRLERPLFFGLLLPDLAEHGARQTAAPRRRVADRSAPPQVDSTSSAVGHGALWTDPSRHHDQTSSVTNGRNGANRRSITESAVSSVGVRRCRERRSP